MTSFRSIIYKTGLPDTATYRVDIDHPTDGTSRGRCAGCRRSRPGSCKIRIVTPDPLDLTRGQVPDLLPFPNNDLSDVIPSSKHAVVYEYRESAAVVILNKELHLTRWQFSHLILRRSAVAAIAQRASKFPGDRTEFSPGRRCARPQFIVNDRLAYRRLSPQDRRVCGHAAAPARLDRGCRI